MQPYESAAADNGAAAATAADATAVPVARDYDPLVLAACDEPSQRRRRRVDVDENESSGDDYPYFSHECAAKLFLLEQPLREADDVRRYLEAKTLTAEFKGPVARDAMQYVSALKRRVAKQSSAIVKLRGECYRRDNERRALRQLLTEARRAERNLHHGVRRYSSNWSTPLGSAFSASAPASPAREDEVPARKRTHETD
jgi:hypothetical protein